MLAVAAAGCDALDEAPAVELEQHSIAPLGPGFIDPDRPPAPESTIRPQPGSWDAVHPPPRYQAVLLTAGHDAATTTLVEGVRQWAAMEGVRLATVEATGPDRHVTAIVDAMNHPADLIICAGPSLVDALALVTPSHLDRQFLIVGAQLPEPTVNVTAAIWPGASSRGREVPDTAGTFRPGSFTSEQVSAAIRAGVASVLHHVTGIVIMLD